MTYDNPTRITYTLLAATVSTAATLDVIAGPKGAKGRVESIVFVPTTATTVDDTVLSVGTVADTDKYATNTVPVLAINGVANDTVLLNTDANPIPADTAVAIATDGGSTAGAGNIFVTIAWF